MLPKPTVNGGQCDGPCCPPVRPVEVLPRTGTLLSIAGFPAAVSTARRRVVRAVINGYERSPGRAGCRLTSVPVNRFSARALFVLVHLYETSRHSFDSP